MFTISIAHRQYLEALPEGPLKSFLAPNLERGVFRHLYSGLRQLVDLPKLVGAPFTSYMQRRRNRRINRRIDG